MEKLDHGQIQIEKIDIETIIIALSVMSEFYLAKNQKQFFHVAEKLYEFIHEKVGKIKSTAEIKDQVLRRLLKLMKTHERMIKCIEEVEKEQLKIRNEQNKENNTNINIH